MNLKFKNIEKSNGGIIDVIGNTPMIRLNYFSNITNCEILGKAEFLNPGGSVKDRAALSIINDAEESGFLKKGSTIIEGTAGNTGIGLTLVANAKGYKSIVVIPNTQSAEKIEMLKLCGANIKQVPAVPYKDENNYIKISKKLAEELNYKSPKSAYWANQFDNISNQRAHYQTTGPEIWDQTKGNIDAFICAVGTGGTLSGVSNFLKTKNKKIRIGLADPHGASLYSYYTKGVLESNGSSITEGIGQGRITKNLEKLKVDYPFQISDKIALLAIYDLIRYEGLALGLSSGINIAASVKLAEILGPGHTIVTILCDSANRYASKIFNKEFLEKKNLPQPPWLKNS
ncbi:cysteine synthase A [Alphaproteobacteria bacterium]|nr:cysteine synthase A [Alphaproteobacteria bacterium]